MCLLALAAACGEDVAGSSRSATNAAASSPGTDWVTSAPVANATAAQSAGGEKSEAQKSEPWWEGADPAAAARRSKSEPGSASPQADEKALGSRRKSRAADPDRATERAVLDGLRWLVRHQNGDGSWSAATLRERCSPQSPCVDAKESFTHEHDVGITALASLCFLHAGFSNQSKQDIVDTVLAKRHNLGEVVKNGLQVLVHRQNADGSFADDPAFLYDDAVATLALVECYAATHLHYWRKPAQHGIEFLLSAQRKSPDGNSLWGWRSASRAEIDLAAKRSADLDVELCDSDSWATALCTHVLHAARECELTVSDEALAGALAFTRWATSDASTATQLALGISTRLDASGPGNVLDGPFFDLAAERLAQDPPAVSASDRSIDYALSYWGLSALDRFDGPDGLVRQDLERWRPWSNAVEAALLPLQDQTDRSCRQGGWFAHDLRGSDAGPIYATAMSLLTLEIRFATEETLRARARAQASVVGAQIGHLEALDINRQLINDRSLAGRVVLIDFHSAEQPEAEFTTRGQLVARLEKKPFLLIEVRVGSGLQSNDPEIPAEHQEIWRRVRETGSHSHLMRQFAVGELPTRIVIDAQGVIRSRGSSREEAEACIDRLVSDTAAPTEKK